MFRILFVILAAAVITFSSIILGNYLQKKVDEAEAARATSEPAQEQITSRPRLTDSEAAQRSVSAVGLELRNYRTEDAVVAAVNQLAEHYDTLLVDLGSSEGTLLYTSPALCDLMRIPVPEEDSKLTLVRSALTAAKSRNLYLCAVVDTSFGLLDREVDEAVDGALFAELASFGVDEILIKNTVIDTENIPADEIADYLSGCAEITKGACALGVLFPDDAFLNFSNARDIQTIASAADFTGIDMTSYESIPPDEMYEKMTQNITSLYGSFSIYNMRVVLSTAAAELLAAQYQALLDSSITNICLTETILPDVLVYNRPSDIPAEEPTAEPEETTNSVQPESNPYAVGIADETEETLETEEPSADDVPEEDTEETPSVSDSWYYDENGNRVNRWY